MEILDLIRNYGSRRVVREKDKAIIELAVNGGVGSNEIDTKVITSLTAFENIAQQEIGVAQFRFFNSEVLRTLVNDNEQKIMVESISVDSLEEFGDGLFTLAVFKGSNDFNSVISSDSTIIDENFSTKTIDEIMNESNNGNYYFYIAYKLDFDKQKLHFKIYKVLYSLD